MINDLHESMGQGRDQTCDTWICVTLTSKSKNQIIYFLVNASPPKLLDKETSNFAVAKVT